MQSAPHRIVPPAPRRACGAPVPALAHGHSPDASDPAFPPRSLMTYSGGGLYAFLRLNGVAGRAIGAILLQRGQAWHATVGATIAYRDARGALDLPLPMLPGAHQADNVALAVAMLRHQDTIIVSPEAMARGIVAALLPGTGRGTA
eukprot:gene7814-7879_t